MSDVDEGNFQRGYCTVFRVPQSVLLFFVLVTLIIR